MTKHYLIYFNLPYFKGGIRWPASWDFPSAIQLQVFAMWLVLTAVCWAIIYVERPKADMSPWADRPRHFEP